MFYNSARSLFGCQYAMPLQAACEALGRTLQDLLRNQVWEESLLYLAIFDKLFLSFHENLKKMKCKHSLSHHVHTIQKICLKINTRTQIEGDREKSPIMGRFPNMGRCIISYQEVLRPLLKNVND
jgi:hypothetical protein